MSFVPTASAAFYTVTPLSLAHHCRTQSIHALDAEARRLDVRAYLLRLRRHARRDELLQLLAHGLVHVALLEDLGLASDEEMTMTLPHGEHEGVVRALVLLS